MATPLRDQVRAQMRDALNHARETLHQIAENEGDLGWNQDFWNEGGEGYKALEQINAALAAAKAESTLEQMASSRLFVLMQMSLETASDAARVLVARKPQTGTSLEEVLDRELANQVRSLNTEQRGRLPEFQALLLALLDSLGGA